MKRLAQILRASAWLGWQVEANWAEPALFLIYAVAKHAHELYVVLVRILLFLLVFVPVSAYEPWLRGRLKNVWREWMTRSFVEMGFAHRAFYQMIMGGYCGQSRPTHQ